MLNQSKIGEWTEQRLAQFVQALPSVQRHKDDGATRTGSVAGAIPDPSPKTTDDGVFFNGFVWVAGKVTNARVAAGAAIAYSKLALAASIKASDMNSQASASGTVLTADGAGGASYAAAAASGASTARAFFLGG